MSHCAIVRQERERDVTYFSRVATTPPDRAVKPGDSFSLDVDFDARSIAEFAERTGDRNPVHTDPQAGATSRFGKRIASGQHVISLMLGLAATWMAQRGTSFGLGCSFRFTAAVREGDEIALRWTVTETVFKESLRGMIVVLQGTATNAAGLICCRGRLEMLLQS